MNAESETLDDGLLEDEESESAGRLKQWGVTKQQLFFFLGIIGVVLIMVILDLTGLLNFNDAFKLDERVQQNSEMKESEKEAKESKKPKEVAVTGKKQSQQRSTSRAAAQPSQTAAQPKQVAAAQPEVKKPTGVQLGEVRVGRSKDHYPIAPHTERRALSDMTNHTSQNVVKAKVVMEFIDRKGQTIERRELNPLVVSGGVLGDQEQPIKPGETRQFAASINSLPNSWRGKVRTQLEGVQYEGVKTAMLLP
uniref:Uncharacterized protein n=1 Tax=Magnetococcus massalia (strain MO-1) TaxID=451514 RepID=A0A1S7LH48_MAGMO|nr:conserved protein of unknown function [Candidatus Magnetococcus massalia]